MFDVRVLSNRVRDSLWVRRDSAWLFSAFAVMALLLAGGGIYGVVSYTVLGANTRSVSGWLWGRGPSGCSVR